MTLEQYKLEYAEAMRAQGVSVSWNEDGGSPYGIDAGVFTTPDNWVATLSRDGVTSTALISLGRIGVTGMSPGELARQDVQFSLKRAGQLGSLQGQLPSSWFAPIDDDTRRFYEVYPHLAPGYIAPISSPGPSTTVPTGIHSTQTKQAPPVPNMGTKVNSPTTTDSNRMYTFWEWNYFFEQKSGRVGPAPEEVGVVSGNQLMTGAQWSQAVSGWYGTPVSASPPSESIANPVGTTATTPAIAVGGTGIATGSPQTVGGNGTAPAVGTPEAMESFWAWNALREQKTGIPGDDPAHYGIAGTDRMTLAEWTALTAAYYAGKQPTGPARPGATYDYLLIGGALLAGYLILKDR